MAILGKKQMSEEDIKLNYITPVIQRGWKGHITMETKITDGRINIRGNIVARSKPKYADYLLYLNDGKPIAVVEAKDNNHSVSHGLQQAMTYAQMMDLPFAYSSKLFCRKSSIASMGGCIATNATTFNRELLIVEKANDGKPFELHTSYADKEKYYRTLRNPWLFLLLLFALFAIIKHSIILGIFSLVSAIPSILYQLQIINVRQKAKTWEK